MSDRAVLITGGSGGIGQAVCRSLLDAGCRVLNFDQRASPFEHPGLVNIQVDLSETAATARVAYEQGCEQPISILVHNAGVIRPAAIEDVLPDDFDYLGALHLKCALVLLQACLPTLKQAEQSRVVLISSRAALGLPTRSAYSATKAGLIGLTRTWALELAPHRITVNAIAPGPIAGTDMFHELIPRDSAQMESLGRAIPLGRLGAPADVANAVEFFVSPRSSFVTGQVMYVCGGASVGTLVL